MNTPTYHIFNPDLIIEATSVCDRACPGCYAPNVVATGPAENIYQASPDLFLIPEALLIALQKLNSKMPLATFRGGEPTRHPEIGVLLSIARIYASSVYLETHGRWLLPENNEAHQALIETIAMRQIMVKISFDKMHGLTSEELRKITQYLDMKKISYLVAITEKNEQEFLNTRSLCQWVNDSAIIFQKKAVTLTELVVPKYGVIGINGTINNNLSVKSRFQAPSQRQIESRRFAL